MSEFLERIVAEESAKQAIRPFVFALEGAIDDMDSVEFAEIDPDSGNILVTTTDGLEMTVKAELSD